MTSCSALGRVQKCNSPCVQCTSSVGGSGESILFWFILVTPSTPPPPQNQEQQNLPPASQMSLVTKWQPFKYFCPDTLRDMPRPRLFKNRLLFNPSQLLLHSMYTFRLSNLYASFRTVSTRNTKASFCVYLCLPLVLVQPHFFLQISEKCLCVCVSSL